jgi:hypothetical protein
MVYEPDLWNGGYSELAIELGKDCDRRLLIALQSAIEKTNINGYR